MENERTEIDSITSYYVSAKKNQLKLVRRKYDDSSHTLELTEVAELTDTDKAIDWFSLPGNLTQYFDLHPLSQTEAIGSYKLGYIEHEGAEKCEIILPELTTEKITLTKKQSVLFRILYNSEGYVKTEVLVERIQYRNAESLRKAKDAINQKFSYHTQAANAEQTDLILADRSHDAKGYKLNDLYRVTKQPAE
jgi:hypothetical protein